MTCLVFFEEFLFSKVAFSSLKNEELEKYSFKKLKLYKAVYESKEWVDNIAPTVANLVDRNSILVHNLSSTALSIMK